MHFEVGPASQRGVCGTPVAEFLYFQGRYLAEVIGASIRSQLLRLNSEFANYVPAAYQAPHITLRPAGDTEYFPVGVKHRYTRK
jgi:hypothetical protein